VWFPDLIEKLEYSLKCEEKCHFDTNGIYTPVAFWHQWHSDTSGILTPMAFRHQWHFDTFWHKWHFDTNGILTLMAFWHLIQQTFIIPGQAFSETELSVRWPTKTQLNAFRHVPAHSTFCRLDAFCRLWRFRFLKNGILGVVYKNVVLKHRI
jgi:hypothetical protein